MCSLLDMHRTSPALGFRSPISKRLRVYICSKDEQMTLSITCCFHSGAGEAVLPTQCAGAHSTAHIITGGSTIRLAHFALKHLAQTHPTQSMALRIAPLTCASVAFGSPRRTSTTP